MTTLEALEAWTEHAKPIGAFRLFTLAFVPNTPPPLRERNSTMVNTVGKENIADGLIANASFKATPSLSPKKKTRKTRSKSIGPGGLGELDAHALKESSGNRRKVYAV